MNKQKFWGDRQLSFFGCSFTPWSGKESFIYISSSNHFKTIKKNLFFCKPGTMAWKNCKELVGKLRLIKFTDQKGGEDYKASEG